MGHSQREQGAKAEKEILEAAELYGVHVCQVIHLPVMMRKAGNAYVHARPSPFDFMGLAAMSLERTLPLAMECKSCSKPATRLAIYTGKKGSGLALHQLSALAEWHRAGGLALVLWRNGGTWMRLGGEAVVAFLEQYEADMANAPRSIPVRTFETCPYGPTGLPAFLEGLDL